MNEEHKNILRTNRSKLVEGIGDVKKVVNRLFEKKVITADMKEIILESHHINTDRKRELLDMIPRRGPNAFIEFFEALKDCEEWDAMECLKPGAGLAAEQAHKSSSHSFPQESRIPVVTTPVEEDLPSVWPDENFSPLSVKVKLVREDNHTVRNKYTRCGISNSDFYCIQRATRGKVLIINNDDFSMARKKGLRLLDREGTNIDATSLDKLFSQLHFKVDTKNNLTAKGIKEIMQAYSQEDHTNADCFVCCILSHGTGGGVYGTDGEVAQIQELTDLFNSQNCLSLAGKPKLFFIQACQGNKVDVGSAGATSLPAPVQPSVPDDEISLKNEKKEQDEFLDRFKSMNLDTKSDAVGEENVPSRADFFVAFATTPDYLSYRNTSKGTWFIQAVSYIFQNYSHSEHLLDMMIKVNNLVSRGEIKQGRHKQGSNFSASFRKKFYFFPGLFIHQELPFNPFNQVQASS